jgi:hypothetical protein
MSRKPLNIDAAVLFFPAATATGLAGAHDLAMATMWLCAGVERLTAGPKR